MLMKVMITMLSLFIVAEAEAQSDIEILKAGQGSVNNYVRYNNTSALGDKNAGAISYSDVEGTPFWKTEWNTALLICSGDRAFILQQVRLNIYTGDVHYMDSLGREMIAADMVEQIIFYRGQDTTRLSAVFEKFPASGVSNNFYQVLNHGRVKLLRLYSAKIDSRVDAIAGKTINKFVSKSGYFIADDEIINSLKKLDKENILPHILYTPVIQQWLDENKNSLKNEQQVASFLNYYNQDLK